MSMAFDYKKEYREFYLPPRTPGLIDVPKTRYIAVSGSGDPRRTAPARLRTVLRLPVRRLP